MSLRVQSAPAFFGVILCVGAVFYGCASEEQSFLPGPSGQGGAVSSTGGAIAYATGGYKPGTTYVQPQAGNTALGTKAGTTVTVGGSTGANTVVGNGGTTGVTTSTGVTATGGTTTAATTAAIVGTCVDDFMTLITGTANWIPNGEKTCGMQGSIYAYGDSATNCTSPSPLTSSPCSAGKCCISGTTVTDATYAAYGCGLGFDLNSGTGASATKYAYKAPATGFTIKISGTIKTGQKIRIKYASTATPPTGGTAPYTEISAVGTHTVKFSEVKCPSWATAAQCTVPTAGVYSLQIEVVGGGTDATVVGPFTNVCIESLVPTTT